ncbi:MAG: penicillin-binding transpeptidase domain-containing protein, partial [Phycisphaerae bacterium]
ARLVDIQILRADEFSALVDVVSPKQIAYIRPPRGAILDRNGRVLVADEPSSDITMYYPVLANREAYFLREASRAIRRGDVDPSLTQAAVAAGYRKEIDDLLNDIARIAQIPREEINTRIDALVDRIGRIREKVGSKVREEETWHSIVEDLDDKTTMRIQMELADSRWIRILPGSRRTAFKVDAVAHLVGRMGRLGTERLAKYFRDPYAGDELRELGPRDRMGVGGVELLAENVLRGSRGKFVQNFATGEKDRIAPVAGTDVYLTIDMELQEAIYAILDKAVKSSPHPAGAAAVVIDVQTREVMAAVSYPTYSYEDFSENYDALQKDGRRAPLRSKAIQNVYPPGSTCKAITTVGGLSERVVSAAEKIHCTGHLLPHLPKQFRCWIYKQFSITHDYEFPDGQTAADAIRNSCNIYFFHVGERLGAARLCNWFEQFGIGHTCGTGLIEENPGIVPTAEWLQQRLNRKVDPADPWNWSIGQGEISATPLQVANIAATVATGRWEPVIFARTADGQILGGTDLKPHSIASAALTPVREGMWRVVNERGGTAYESARLGPEFARFKFCGKTGSAQTQPLILNRRYIFERPDGSREEVVASTEEEATETFGENPPKCVGFRAHERFPEIPEDGSLPAHAWFMGFTQSAETLPGAAPRGASYAISVLIEFGGSGGREAGPVAKEIAELVLKRGKVAG